MKTKNKNTNWTMRASQNEKVNISRLARRWRVSESDAVRLAVLQSLQSSEVPKITFSFRPIEPRRKAAA